MNLKMKTHLFDYELPPGAIAQKPLPRRDASRLLVLDRRTGAVVHSRVRNLDRHLAPGDLLVLNESRVIPARLPSRRATGGRAEVFLLKPLGGRAWEALVSPARRLRPPCGLHLEAGGEVRVEEALGEGRFRVSLPGAGSVRRLLSRAGRVPLPPYIRRPDDLQDRRRYQTVFARRDGSVAAPTAGLHFTRGLLKRLLRRGVRTARLTLHVGLGTFLPVTAEDLEDHPMHGETYKVPVSLARAVAEARSRGGRVVAVGTTTVRALEHCADGRGGVAPGRGETRLFLKPGMPFRVVDALFTNFHQPRSTLMALVCAFAERERVMAAYAEALRRGYRFLSYGDAMLIL